MYKNFLVLLLAAWVSFASAQDVKAVYHLTTGIDTAAAVLNNIKNHLDADPKAKILVVTNGAGIDFLLQDAKDSRGREFSSPVSTLADRGVEFRVCNNTLTDRNISPDKLLMETKIVPSGVAEAARLQAREGFVYIKP
ncbi:MAG: DsrE family protein [Rhodoferax sp.]|uniref:DsrE family protein n=1 Tax=Rhodoferax sp. TaxID=50421 RepID=UPI0027226BEE|nr:DsrE family protein [Rhodoferax sp.]MDO8448937.1 DsrE family protein [Rhodoferax sp.]